MNQTTLQTFVNQGQERELVAVSTDDAGEITELRFRAHGDDDGRILVIKAHDGLPLMLQVLNP